MAEQTEGKCDFTALAEHIDSTVDPDLMKQLEEIETFNIFLNCGTFGNEELIPVGSCVDGSKITLPNDSGDIDVLIVSNKVLLKESLFDYDENYPAFLHIRVHKEHEKYFKTVTNPIKGVYLPTVVLKDLKEKLFFMSKVWLDNKTKEGVSKDGKYLDITRTSAVGKEQMKLYQDEQISFAFGENTETLQFRLKRMENFAKCALSGILKFPNSTKKFDDEDETNAFETEDTSPVSVEHENTPLLELFQKLLDKGETNKTDAEIISDEQGEGQSGAMGNETCDGVHCNDHGPDHREHDHQEATDNGVCDSLRRKDNDPGAEGYNKEPETNGQNDGIKCRNFNIDRSRDSTHEIAEDRKCNGLQDKGTANRDESRQVSPEIYSAEHFCGGDKCKRILSEECAIKGNRKKIRLNSGLIINCENKNGMNADFPEMKDNMSTDSCIVKPAQRESEQNEARLSKLKSIDLVPAFRFEGWPRVADEWVNRSRKWPSKVTVNTVLEIGCQVVAKRRLALSNKPIPEHRDPFFRLSFALSEIVLARSMKKQHLLCWRVLKTYQKCFLETKPKCLTSYHWKNVVFWVGEDYEESFWTDESVSLAVLKCLDFMHTCLLDRKLPFYFVRQMNLFDGCDVLLLDSLRKQVDEIRRKPLEFLKRFIEEPPMPALEVIDVKEIKDKLSKDSKAKSTDRISEEMVNGLIGNFPSFCQDGPKFQKQLHETVTNVLKRVRSGAKVEEEDVPQGTDFTNGLQEKMLDRFEKIADSMEKESDGKEFCTTVGDLLQSLSHDVKIEGGDEAVEGSLANMFSTLSSFMSGINNEESESADDANKFFSSFHTLTTKMQEKFDSEHNNCAESDGSEDRDATEILSTCIGTFPKFIEGMRKGTENGNESYNVIGEFKKILNEASQNIGSITRRGNKDEKKSQMDIDLD